RGGRAVLIGQLVDLPSGGLDDGRVDVHEVSQQPTQHVLGDLVGEDMVERGDSARCYHSAGAVLTAARHGDGVEERPGTVIEDVRRGAYAADAESDLVGAGGDGAELGQDGDLGAGRREQVDPA